MTNKYAHLFPKTFDTYIEPFLGSGSVFFHLATERAHLVDTNQELIATYSGLRDDPMSVEDVLLRHEMNHCEAYYYSVRDARPRTSHMKAARFIYLNRTCFNGIYRVNLNGTFNVPKGSKTDVVFDDDDFENAARALKRSKICISDFERFAHLSSQDETKALSRVQIAFSGTEEDILKSKTPGYMRMLTMSHRFVIPTQAKKFEALIPPSLKANA